MIRTDVILEQARALGATAAGVAELRTRAAAPSYAGAELVDLTGSLVVITLDHPADAPELDWWGGRGGTLGNRQLIKTSRGLVRWLRREHDVTARDLAYQVERGGIFLKDAAALAGLGGVGQNNLLLTRDQGPRVRLRALQVELELEPTGPVEDDPCAGCDRPCHQACPQRAFADGSYDRDRCGVLHENSP